jgi:small conductance mechanosensitive channel
VILPETAEQIEARKDAEQSELVAKQAEMAVLSFLERKAALQEQIDLEKSLLEQAEQAKANIVQAVEIRRQELADKIAAGAGQAEMRAAQKNIESVNESLSRANADIDTREDTLGAFYERMQALQEEQLVVTREAERKREEAEAARRESIWLDSPLNPLNVVRWAMDRGPRILAVILAVGVLLLLVRHFVQRIARAMVGKGQRHRRTSTTRADTLALSFGSAATMIIIVIGTLMVFQEAGVDIATILGGAAILGVAIAFGAQNLMRDYFNGFIVLIEDQFELNDLVTINTTTGRVERVTLRTTALRDLQGKLHFIPNGEIKSVTNRSYEWARIVFDIRVAYKENVDRVMDVIMEVARKLCAEEDYKDAIIEDPEMLGVDQFSEFGVVIKFVLKTEPDRLFVIKREMLRRIKNRFDELGIEIPIPDAVVLGR